MMMIIIGNDQVTRKGESRESNVPRRNGIIVFLWPYVDSNNNNNTLL